MDIARHLNPPKVYIYHADHEHDRTYTENVVEYLVSQGVLWRSITLTARGSRPELQLALDDHATLVLGYNSQLDHSWLQSGSFMQAAEERGVTVVQWILDHPSSRWSEFSVSTPANSRFLFNSEHERQYFETYCLPGALTAITGGVGPNQRSRIGALTRQAFMRRPFPCMVPLSLHRVHSIEENDAAIKALERPLADVVRDATLAARSDLSTPLHSHLTAALEAHNQSVSLQTFNSLCRNIEQSVQTFRRLKIFATAQKYPVLIQSDRSAAAFIQNSTALLATNVSMQLTLARMPLCRAVLSVCPATGIIHDRTMNALNAGCVAIAEDSPASRELLQHKQNALLFRYDDDSLDECLNIVCRQPERAYEIAQAGMQLRDDLRVRFGQFHNILDLAQRRRELTAVPTAAARP
jgi:Glycosyl transferases group 1